MGDTAAHAVTRIESKRVQAALPIEHHDRDAAKRAGTRESGLRKPVAATPAAEQVRSTDLAFQVDAVARRVTVHVIDRETKSVVRSFPLVMPGGRAAEGDAERGSVVDAKA